MAEDPGATAGQGAGEAAGPARGAVLVTGGGGFIGQQVVQALAASGAFTAVLAADLRPPRALERLPGVRAVALDVRDRGLGALLAAEAVETVVHLAAVVSPRPDQGRDELYDIDVRGSANVVQGCLQAGVRRFVYTSSGAAYGYHADNAPLLDEGAPLRGNEAFAYSHHKRLIELHLAEVRERAPALEQVVFRVSTVLGPTVNNQITAIFERPLVIGVRGADSPFCFVHVEDVVAALLRGSLGGPAGVWNLTGDGVLTLREIAAACGRPFLAVPEPALRAALTALSARGWSPYGPEQIAFLKHRPVLDNRRLREGFGLRLAYSSRAAFAAWLLARLGRAFGGEAAERGPSHR